MSERLNLAVDDGIGDKMSELAGGERKRGQWLSDLVRGMAVQTVVVSGADFEALRMSNNGMAVMVRSLEGRVLHLEQQLAAMIANDVK